MFFFLLFGFFSFFILCLEWLISSSSSSFTGCTMFVSCIRRTAVKTKVIRPRQFTSSSTTSSSSSSSSSSSLHVDCFPFEASVAFQPKEREENNRMMRRHMKIQRVESPSGEDNYFIAKAGTKLACGVADGVGGWAELGYDSSAISRELCNSMKESFTNGDHQSPVQLLNHAFDKIQNEDIVKVGGTTACLGIFEKNTLKVANLGDSWCGVFRQGSLVAETKVQTHGFNTPYQLAIIPNEIKTQNKGSSFIMDQPDDADEYEFNVIKDDIVIFATDGVIDNIDVKDIELYLKDNEKTPLEELSSKFVQNVYGLSIDENFPSVFSQELSQLTGQFYSGGKEDDITVVMVKVQ